MADHRYRVEVTVYCGELGRGVNIWRTTDVAFQVGDDVDVYWYRSKVLSTQPPEPGYVEWHCVHLDPLNISADDWSRLQVNIESGGKWIRPAVIAQPSC